MQVHASGGDLTDVIISSFEFLQHMVKQLVSLILKDKSHFKTQMHGEYYFASFSKTNY